MIFYQVLDYQVQAFIMYKNGVVQKSFESWELWSWEQKSFESSKSSF